MQVRLIYKSAHEPAAGAALSSQKKVEANKKMAGTEKNAGCMTDRFRPKRPSPSPNPPPTSIHLKSTVDAPPSGSRNAPSLPVPARQFRLGDLPFTHG